MAKIYTRCGDHGTTSLIGGERVDKIDSRVEAYGSVDELGAHVAMLTDLAAEAGHTDTVAFLDGVATRLMTIESQLAVGLGFKGELAKIGEEDVRRVEAEIDRLSESLPAMRCFTIPGGAVLISQCHICRTVCRRAEREVLRVTADHSVAEPLLCYLNRLSDYFYTLGRSCAHRLGVEEKMWNV
ncbi:MAG: cob(I)yrinic acid a,c-diamide adenosyltransferase [Tidjanibacter sp.]|nr:cob(I)yrinic acid a,c-diamide adenosyltransferase [Tidjanibacter sp.]MBR3931609.1 cob(I)yrinic acid a,c-diamide adenosyltransferase [Tidjanibacter sp.]